MKIRLKHLGYGLLLVTAFLNFWFYRFNLHVVFFNDFGEPYECSFYDPCLNNPLLGGEPWEGYTEEYGDTRTAEMGAIHGLSNYFAAINYQIFWIEMFLTAMLDTMAVAFALALILRPERDNK